MYKYLLISIAVNDEEIADLNAWLERWWHRFYLKPFAKCEWVRFINSGPVINCNNRSSVSIYTFTKDCLMLMSILKQYIMTRWLFFPVNIAAAMVTSSSGSIFRVTGPLWWESTVHQWRGALMLSLICAWANGWTTNRDADDLRRHRAHYDATVMCPGIFRFQRQNDWIFHV